MNTKPQNQPVIFGTLCALGATAIWAGNYIIARSISDSILPVSLAFWRWLVAVVVLTAIAYKRIFAEWVSIKKHLGYLALTGLLGVTLFNTLVYIASHTTTALNLSLISITFPVFILILSRIFYRESLTVIKGIGIILVLTGVVVLITKGKISTLMTISFAIGDIWMLIAAVFWAFYSILLKRKPKELSAGALQLSTFVLGLAFLFPLYLWESASASPIVVQPRLVLAILYVGVVSSLLAFFLWNKSIEMMGPSKAGMIYYTSPLIQRVAGIPFSG